MAFVQVMSSFVRPKIVPVEDPNSNFTLEPFFLPYLKWLAGKFVMNLVVNSSEFTWPDWVWLHGFLTILDKFTDRKKYG